MIDGVDDMETCIVFRGSGIPQEREDELSEAVAERLKRFGLAADSGDNLRECDRFFLDFFAKGAYRV